MSALEYDSADMRLQVIAFEEEWEKSHSESLEQSESTGTPASAREEHTWFKGNQLEKPLPISTMQTSVHASVHKAQRKEATTAALSLVTSQPLLPGSLISR